MTDERPDFSSRFGPNIVSNLIYIALNMLIGIMLVPYYINNLGIAAYGVIPLATTLTSYVSVITDALCSSVSRYMCIGIQGGDMESSERVYSTAVFGILRVVLTILPVAILLSLLAPFIFSTGGVPDMEIIVFFLLMLGSVLLNSWGYNFTIIMYANNRLDLQNYIKTIQIVLQTFLIVLFFVIVSKSLVCVGAAYMITAVVVTAISYYESRKVSPELKAVRSGYDKKTFKDIGNLGVWNAINTIGNLLFVEASIIVANLLLDSSAEGAFSTVTTMVAAITVLGSAVSSVFTPLTYYNYAHGYMDRLVDTCILAVKVTGIFVAVPLAFICAFSGQILTVWIGSGFMFLRTAVWIMLGVLVATIAVSPIYPISPAKLKVKIPGIMTLFFGVVNVLLALLFVAVFNMGLEGIAAAWAISMVLKNCVFNTMYHAHIIDRKKSTFVWPLIPGIVCFATTCVVYMTIDKFIGISPSLLLLVVMFVITTIPLMILWVRLFMNHDERSKIVDCVPEPLRCYAEKLML